MTDRERFLAWEIPYFPRSRKTGYAPQKNWLRTHIDKGGMNVHVIGERSYVKYREPSERWTREISRALGQTSLVSHVLALGIARNSKSGQEVPVVLFEIYSMEEWVQFKQLHHALMVVTRYYKPGKSSHG